MMMIAAHEPISDVKTCSPLPYARKGPRSMAFRWFLEKEGTELRRLTRRRAGRWRQRRRRSWAVSRSDDVDDSFGPIHLSVCPHFQKPESMQGQFDAHARRSDEISHGRQRTLG